MLVICKFSVPYGALNQVYFSYSLSSKLAFLSQKYPKASFTEISKLIHDVKDVYKECCEGDMVECMDDRVS